MSDDKITVTVDADLEELIPGFLENRKTDIENLQNAVNDANFSTLQSIGHSLKGVGGGYGFQQLSEIGAGIETAAKEQNMETISGLVDEMAVYLDKVEVVYE